MGKYFVGGFLAYRPLFSSSRISSFADAMKRTRAFIAAAATVAGAGALGTVYAQSAGNGAAPPERPPSVVPTPPSTSLHDAMRAAGSQRRTLPATRDRASGTSAEPAIDQAPTSGERAPRADRN